MRLSWSLSFCLVLSLSACASVPKPPKLTTCILDPPSLSLQCFDPIKNTKYPIDISFSQDYVCFPIEDAKSLILYLKMVGQ